MHAKASKVKLPSLAQLDVERVKRKGLAEFVRTAWSQVEPKPLVWNWHLDSKCDALTKVSSGEIRRLIINEPPGFSKSLIVCVFWPVWEWIVRPETKWIFASFDSSLSRRDSNRALMLMQSEWFRERWPHVKPTAAPMGTGTAVTRVAVNDFHNSRGGFRFSTSVNGRVTGRHADIQVVDDPIKPLDALNASVSVSLKALEKVTSWWAHTMPTRMADPINGRRVIIMQRLHERDLAGEMLAQGGWHHLRIPMRYEADNPNPWDPRMREGELANLVRFPLEVVDRLEREMGSAEHVAAQHQQRPSAASGNIFKKDWFQRYDKLPTGFGYFVQVWDLTFKKEGTSRVCGDLWAQFGSKKYLVDRVVRRMSFTETLEEIKTKCKDPMWKRAHAILIEEKANGPAIIDTLRKDPAIRHSIIGLNGENMPATSSSKEERASAAAPQYEAKNVYHPNEPWIAEGEANLTSFPRGRADDEVDTTSYALLWFASHSGGLVSAMQGIRK